MSTWTFLESERLAFSRTIHPAFLQQIPQRVPHAYRIRSPLHARQNRRRPIRQAHPDAAAVAGCARPTAAHHAAGADRFRGRPVSQNVARTVPIAVDPARPTHHGGQRGRADCVGGGAAFRCAPRCRRVLVVRPRRRRRSLFGTRTAVCAGNCGRPAIGIAVVGGGCDGAASECITCWVEGICRNPILK